MPRSAATSNELRNVTGISGFLRYFRETADWPLALDDFEDVESALYDFSADDLGIKPKEFAKIRSLRQLPPLEDGQPWGIFCVEFDTERFALSALRKILSRLVPSRRNATSHAVWDEDDLLFLCSWGTGCNRTICLAHFERKEEGISIVRTLHCSPAVEDPMILSRFADRLAKFLWPKDTSNPEKWRETWASAFGAAYREVIRTSEELAARMAEVAVEIRDNILEAIQIETANGFAHQLFAKVKSTLLHDLREREFADMYAQTIVYGLFSARCLDPTPETFSVREAISLIPGTNPFLKGLMRDCFAVRNGGLSFDELGIGDVVDMFAHVNAQQIAEDFGRRTGSGREDPIIYFYEEFLRAYDREQKLKCGEFYTPLPVVAFMVRAVDSILRTNFNLPDGLATVSTKVVKVVPPGKKSAVSRTVPAIQILDPATGTGTFLREIILNIYDTFKRKNSRLSGKTLAEAWSRYVDSNVLPRLNGFELMMAPYAIAHMKLAMVLQETGYDFKGSKRLQVFLTNTLEEPGNSDGQLSFWEDPLAAESVAANQAKKNHAINVVIGNPPYSGVSQNRGKECEWLNPLLDEYRLINGVNIRERRFRITNDYIKFLRYGQKIIADCGIGILAFINPHAYLNGPTCRGMRWNLLREFDTIYILNLHGDVKTKEKTPDGGKDENVFTIKEGVTINIFIKDGTKKNRLADVYYSDLWGEQNQKYTYGCVKEKY